MGQKGTTRLGASAEAENGAPACSRLGFQVAVGQKYVPKNPKMACPGKWKGLKPAVHTLVAWWLNFDPHPGVTSQWAMTKPCAGALSKATGPRGRGCFSSRAWLLAYWVWVKDRYLTWNPGTWSQGGFTLTHTHIVPMDVASAGQEPGLWKLWTSQESS